MENLETLFRAFTSQVSILILGFSAAFSFTQCFFGYKLRKLWIVCVGFLVGFVIGLVGGALLIPPSDYVLLFAVLIGIALGLLSALAAMKLYHAGMFLYSFLIVFTAVSGLFPDKLSWLGLIAGLAAGIAAGILTLRFLRPFVICTTAIGGGLSGAQQLLALCGVTSLPVILCAGGAAAVLGLAAQFILNPRHPEHGTDG